MKEAGGGGKRRGQRARCLCGGPRRRAGTGGRGRGPHAAPERLARCAGGPASGGAAVRGDEPRGAVGQCEGTVQGLDDRRQELPAGLAKEAHTYILFILMRFTRLLQFRRVPPRGAATPTSSSTTTDATCSACTSSATSASTRSMSTAGTSDTRAPPASLSSRSALSGTLEHKQLTLNFSSVRIFSPSGDGSAVDGHSPSSKMAFWKKLPSPAEKNKISKNAGAGEIFSRSSLPPPRRTRPARTLERVKYSFSNFSFKNISQLASMNYDLMTKHNLDPLQSSK